MDVRGESARRGARRGFGSLVSARRFTCVLVAGCLFGTVHAVEGAAASLRVGAYRNHMSALDYLDQAGVRQGLNASVLRTIADREGVALAYRGYATVDEAGAALTRGEIDVAPVACEDAASKVDLSLSRPYATLRVGVVLARGRQPPRTLTDLARQRVVVARGGMGAAALKAKLSGTEVTEMSDVANAMGAVASGRADAYVGIHPLNVGAVNALALGTLETVAMPQSIALCLASRRDAPSAAAMIARGLASISPSVLSELAIQPMPPTMHRTSGPASFVLSRAERAWAWRHPVVRVGVQRLGRPYDFVDDQGRWHGLGATLLRELAPTAGLQFVPVLLDAAVEPADALQDGTVDLVSSFPLGPRALMHGLAATRAYDSFPWSYVRPERDDPMGDRIATTPWRMRRVVAEPGLTDATLVPRTSAADALRAVLAGNADAALINVIAAEELGERYAHRRLTIDATIAGVERIGFAAAASNRALAMMLDRYVASYTPRELARLASRARPLTIVLGYEKRAVIGLASGAAAIALAVIATLAWAYRRTRAARGAAVVARAEAIAAREQAMAADRAKSAFVAMISHEIRTPMNGVVGVLDLLETMGLAPEPRRYLGVAQHSARLMLRVVDDTLDYSKIEQGALTLDAAPFDICASAAAATQLHAPLAARKKLALHLAVMPHFDRRLIGDEVRINQIVTNLLSNAIRFTEQGYVLLEVRRKVTRGRAWLVLSVVDTGAGISERYRARLFTPFTQQDSTTTRRYGGTGLGLSIVKRLVDLMDGTIDVESRIGEGTRVRVRLPIAWGGTLRAWPCVAPARAIVCIPVPAMAAAVRAVLTKMGVRCVGQAGRADFEVSSDAGGAIVVTGRHGPPRSVRAVDDFAGAVVAALSRPEPPRDLTPSGMAADCANGARARLIEGAPRACVSVLVIEDNDINRDIVVRQLRALDVRADAAADGVDGYERWQRIRPAIVLLDCHMPGMDGYTLARKIRGAQGEGERRTTIVAISANATQDDIRACHEAGMDDYLAKPITRAKLAALLEKWAHTADAGTDTEKS